MHKKTSPSKRSSKLKPVVSEKHPARTDPPRKKIVLESSSQPDEEEEESESTLVHRKGKLPNKVAGKSGFSLVVFLAFGLVLMYVCLILQKKFRVNYGFDTKDME